MKIGCIFGSFDLFHVGHLNILEKCKKNCDYLIVGVCNDSYIENYKKKTPVIKEQDRLRIIKALKVVDEAYLIDYETTQNRIPFCKEHNVSIIFDGSDWKDSKRFDVVKENDIEVMFFPYTQGISTTLLKEKMK